MLKFISVCSFLLLVSTNAFAEVNSGDTSWILTSSALVLFDFTWVSFFLCWACSFKECVISFSTNFGIACLIVWVTIGYSIAFSGEIQGYLVTFLKLCLETQMVW